MKTQSNGSVTLGVDFDADGRSADYDTSRVNNYRHWKGVGRLGGGHGQKPGTLAGLGAGGGQGRVGGTLETTDGFYYLGGGGGYGSAGEHSASGFGEVYGSPALAHLHGGSGGGGGQWMGSEPVEARCPSRHMEMEI